MVAIKTKLAETLSLRIVVVDPPPNILWALQLRQEELVKPTANTKSRISFDFTVEVVKDSSPAGFRLSGPAVQGRPGGRFVYLRMGAYAGQAGASAGWRAKIGLEGISQKASRRREGKAVECAGGTVRGNGAKGRSGLRNRATAGSRMARRMNDRPGLHAGMILRAGTNKCRALRNNR